jgi:hypothetical protein
MEAVGVLIAAFFFKLLAFSLVGFLCQILIFMPKILPVLLTSKKKKAKPYTAALARAALVASLKNTTNTEVTTL